MNKEHDITLLKKGIEEDPKKIVENCYNDILDQIRNGDLLSTSRIIEAKQIAKESGNEVLINKMADLKVLIDKIEALNTMRKRFIDEFSQSKPENDEPFTVIAFAGKAGVGKSTVADILKKYMEKNEPYSDHSISIIPFAKEIKLQAKIIGWDGNKDEKGRKLLQDITKPIKTYHGDNYYAKVLFDEASRSGSDILLVDDLRFKAEANYLKQKEAEGKCKLMFVKVDNKNFVSNLTEAAQADISENDLLDFEFDHTIDNSGTMNELEIEIEKFVEHLKAIS